MGLQEIVDAKQLAYDALVEKTALAIMASLTELEKAKADLEAWLAMPRITIALLNEASVPDDVIANYKVILEDRIAHLKENHTLPEVVVITTPQEGAWEVIITQRGRKRTADGYHNVTRAGLPFALIVPGGSLYPYGTYRAGKLAYWIGTKLIPARMEYKRSGVLTVLVHEVLELLIDPFLKTFSEPNKDGKELLIEVCSTSVFGTYYVKKIAGKLCILPNFSFPSAYKLNGVFPFDVMEILQAPFTYTPKSYPYYKGLDGKLVKL